MCRFKLWANFDMSVKVFICEQVTPETLAYQLQKSLPSKGSFAHTFTTAIILSQIMNLLNTTIPEFGAISNAQRVQSCGKLVLSLVSKF